MDLAFFNAKGNLDQNSSIETTMTRVVFPHVLETIEGLCYIDSSASTVFLQ